MAFKTNTTVDAETVDRQHRWNIFEEFQIRVVPSSKL